MPFEIIKRGKVVQVVTQGTGKVHGTFPDTPEGRAEAAAQLRALYANVPEARRGKEKRRR